MRFLRIMAIGAVLLVLACAILGTACAGAKGEPGPNMIVAMANIKSDGTISDGYNVTSCSWNVGIGWYEIALKGIAYNGTDYVTLVTLSLGGVGRTVEKAVAMSGKLAVYIYDDIGNPAQDDFSFVVLECP